MSSQSQWSQLSAYAPAANKCTICGRDDFDCQKSLWRHKTTCTNFSFASTQSASAAAYNFSGGKLRSNTVVRKYSKWKDKFEKEAKSRGKKHEYMDDRISHLKKRQRLCHKSEDSDSDDSESSQSMQDHDIYFQSYNETSGYYSDSDEDLEEFRNGVDNGLRDVDFDTVRHSQSDNSDANVHKHAMTTPTSSATMPCNPANAGMPSATKFQIDLARLLGKHRVNLSLYDGIINLVGSHSNGKKLKFSSDTLMGRKAFVSQLTDTLDAKPMKPTDVDVKLTDGTEVTVCVFDLEAMILSLLTDENLMQPENFAEGYDIYTGKPTEKVTHYGEIHTGDSWEKARSFYCGEGPQNMPIALVLFVDKSFLDSNGGMATTPVSFTLSLFNEATRYKTEAWRTWMYIPNLEYGTVTSEKSRTQEDSEDSVTDEHRCLRVALQDLITISEQGGIAAKVMGRTVILKVWIHFLIGDISGNNRLFGHFNSSGKLARPYRDCKCSFDDLCKSNPTCEYITRREIDEFLERVRDDNVTPSITAKRKEKSKISKLNIDNAFHTAGVPLSDQVHGIFKMTPPELLHTTEEGLSKYMLISFGKLIPDETRNRMELLHQRIHSEVSSNSDNCFPRGSDRSGFGNTAKQQGVEVRGNIFRFVILCHTEEADNWIFPALRAKGIGRDDFLECLKLYLSMEDWFHNTNLIEEVKSARPLIAKVIDLVQLCFPRNEGQGYKLPKTHGLTKMQTSMCLFGSGKNFFGGPGECSHKRFVKDTIFNTHQRADSMVSQVGTRMFEMMLFDVAVTTMDQRKKRKYELIGSNGGVTADDVKLYNQYGATITLSADGEPTAVKSWWMGKHANEKGRCKLPLLLVKTIAHYATTNSVTGSFSVTGYTYCKTFLDDRDVIFRCDERTQRYDFCLVDFSTVDADGDEGDATVSYAAKILGVFKFTNGNGSSVDCFGKDQLYAAVQCSVHKLGMNDLEADFVRMFELGNRFVRDINASNFSVVPMEDITAPLYVSRNYGGKTEEHLCCLPRNRWARYFGSRVIINN